LEFGGFDLAVGREEDNEKGDDEDAGWKAMEERVLVSDSGGYKLETEEV
jgi:hypothetical protein